MTIFLQKCVIILPETDFRFSAKSRVFLLKSQVKFITLIFYTALTKLISLLSSLCPNQLSNKLFYLSGFLSTLIYPLYLYLNQLTDLSCHIMLCVFSVNTEQEASRIEREYKGTSKPRSVNPTFSDFLALVGRLLFYRPIWTKENQKHHNIRFIYVHFSAWHFAGSDFLWAGIVLRLIEAMQMAFGKLQLVLYRVAQHDEEEEVQKKVCGLS